MKKFSELFIKYKEIIMYLIMGFATTFISWVSYSIFTFVFSAFSDDTNVLLSSIVSWTIAVIFAYFTNKIWVFESYSWKPSFVKVTISVVVIVLNYVLSKLVIFKKEVEN